MEPAPVYNFYILTAGRKYWFASSHPFEVVNGVLREASRMFPKKVPLFPSFTRGKIAVLEHEGFKLEAFRQGLMHVSFPDYLAILTALVRSRYPDFEVSLDPEFIDPVTAERPNQLRQMGRFPDESSWQHELESDVPGGPIYYDFHLRYGRLDDLPYKLDDAIPTLEAKSFATDENWLRAEKRRWTEILTGPAMVHTAHHSRTIVYYREKADRDAAAALRQEIVSPSEVANIFPHSVVWSRDVHRRQEKLADLGFTFASPVMSHAGGYWYRREDIPDGLTAARSGPSNVHFRTAEEKAMLLLAVDGLRSI